MQTLPDEPMEELHKWSNPKSGQGKNTNRTLGPAILNRSHGRDLGTNRKKPPSYLNLLDHYRPMKRRGTPKKKKRRH
jgi:hypothetical protein